MIQLLVSLSLSLNVALLYYIFFWKNNDDPAINVPDQLHHLENIEVKKGRVTKVTAPPEFDPDAPQKKGGHVVKRMPRQLQKIKEGQGGI